MLALTNILYFYKFNTSRVCDNLYFYIRSICAKLNILLSINYKEQKVFLFISYVDDVLELVALLRHIHILFNFHGIFLYVNIHFAIALFYILHTQYIFYYFSLFFILTPSLFK